MILKLIAEKENQKVKEHFFRLEGLINFVKDKDLKVMKIEEMTIEDFIKEEKGN